MTRRHVGRAARVAIAAGLLVIGAAERLAGAGRDRKADDAEPRIVRSLLVPRVPLSAGVKLGGLSDLAVAADDEGGLRLWALTDRGPNGTAEIDGERVRTLLAPEFAPAIVQLRLDPRPGADERDVAVERIVPLRNAEGRPCSGRAPGTDRLLREGRRTFVEPDADGIDPEALVALADGTFWIAEEYRPSLAHVAADGTLLARFVPRGTAAGAADREVLPTIYARRRENRGFEALAASPDGSRIWALLQSPLDAPGRKAGTRTGNVRLLAFDPALGAPVAEHVYRLGDPTDRDYRSRGAPPDDGKLCAMAALDGDTLLVLEQDDGGLTRLYAVDLADATDTLGRALDDDRALEQVADLPEAGITPVRKSLVADLGRLRKRMRAEADEGTAGGGALKLEGLAVIDGRHVALVNDDDFGVPQGADGEQGRRTRVWIVELPADLGTLASAP